MLCLFSTAWANDDAANTTTAAPAVYYQDGFVWKSPGSEAHTKINALVQSVFSLENYENAATRNLNNKTNFNTQWVRLSIGGDLLNEQFTYKILHDFVGVSRSGSRKRSAGSTLQDAWIQRNYDDGLRIRFGQFRVPFSRQFLGAHFFQQFVNRSFVTEDFQPGRQAGALAISEGSPVKFQLGLFNGNSTGEGRNRPGLDPNLLYAFMAHWVSDEYGSRAHEGDYEYISSPALTAGLSTIYEEGSSTVAKFKQTRAGLDMGLRYSGFSFQSEAFYRNNDVLTDSTTEDFGFYTQVGAFIVPKKWELALRFAGLFPETNSRDFDRALEYALSVTRFFKGHNLKLSGQLTTEQFELNSGSELTDLRAEIALSAYL